MTFTDARGHSCAAVFAMPAIPASQARSPPERPKSPPES